MPAVSLPGRQGVPGPSSRTCLSDKEYKSFMPAVSLPGRQGVPGPSSRTCLSDKEYSLGVPVVCLRVCLRCPFLADKEYLEFTAALRRGVESLPSAEVQLEQREEAEKAAAGRYVQRTAQYIAAQNSTAEPSRGRHRTVLACITGLARCLLVHASCVSGAAKDAVVVTPLMEFVRERRAMKVRSRTRLQGSTGQCFQWVHCNSTLSRSSFSIVPSTSCCDS